MNATTNRIGLVLSGGGARGVAHVGIIKALEEFGIHSYSLSGSSVGAIVGSLYAAGYGPDAMLDFFRENKTIFKWQHFTFRKPGLLDAEQYAAIYEPWLSGHTFESLSKELHICVTDVLNGEVDYFSSGELVRPLLASAAIPGVFTPVEIMGNWYIDGGTMNNFPVEPLLNQCDFLIGSFVSPKRKYKIEELNYTFTLVNRANALGNYASSKMKFPTCHLLLAPPELYNYGIFDTHKIDELFELGYTYAKINLPLLIEGNELNIELDLT